MLAAVFAISVPVTAQVQDTWIGTWKLNLAKSKIRSRPILRRKVRRSNRKL